MSAASMPPQYMADRIIDYGLMLCMYGERAPGGNETWREFAAKAEDYLRRVDCAKRGLHRPDDPVCPDCAASQTSTGVDDLPADRASNDPAQQRTDAGGPQ